MLVWRLPLVAVETSLGLALDPGQSELQPLHGCGLVASEPGQTELLREGHTPSEGSKGFYFEIPHHNIQIFLFLGVFFPMISKQVFNVFI